MKTKSVFILSTTDSLQMHSAYSVLYAELNGLDSTVIHYRLYKSRTRHMIVNHFQIKKDLNGNKDMMCCPLSAWHRMNYDVTVLLKSLIDKYCLISLFESNPVWILLIHSLNFKLYKHKKMFGSNLYFSNKTC